MSALIGRANTKVARDRSVEVWNVATIGTSEAITASSDRLGVTGSWMCRTSQRPASSHRRVRRELTGPKFTLATDPL